MNESTVKKTTIFTIVNLVLYFLTLGVNYLGSSGFFNGQSQGDISDQYLTLISPAPFTFSIWGVIYSLVLITLVYMFIKRKDAKVSKLVLLITPWFVLLSLCNMCWIIAFSYERLGISSVLIFCKLISLLVINSKIYTHVLAVRSTIAALSFTFYCAWVTISTGVNVSLLLVQL